LDAKCNGQHENSINGLRPYVMTFSDGTNVELMLNIFSERQGAGVFYGK